MKGLLWWDKPSNTAVAFHLQLFRRPSPLCEYPGFIYLEITIPPPQSSRGKRVQGGGGEVRPCGGNLLFQNQVKFPTPFWGIQANFTMHTQDFTGFTDPYTAFLNPTFATTPIC
uniref:Uncharacterized protein n=1 Tax=Eutreptiella gymnastica TaxID=73025 RepID=A0A7S1NFT4_9EUGL|mmetsp:Transcript_29282/g.52662  ORF Transcript_29282/g.52662 Transcript_29282/m.52662 type:complete len:114 (+) Transcript_29282:3-344(+)